MTYNELRRLDTGAFESLGEGDVAYVKPMRSEDVFRVFPQTRAMQPGIRVYALLSASGQPIYMTDSEGEAFAHAWEKDLQTVTLQ